MEVFNIYNYILRCPHEILEGIPTRQKKRVKNDPTRF